ncbi:hypothetical protein A3Q56_00036 [Intoshia linei]|uniref:Uncharacterized protein n=1 Tax=Intoshia linei TaxID=1819745 RepID=A0A177BCY2_9BILA|nr:hypothetical protein A3Q56_00036 [Intoshia linei]
MTYELENCEKCKKLWQCCVDNHRFFRLQNIPSNVSLFDFNESNFNSQATLANTSVCSNIVDNFATNYSRSIEDVEQIEHHSTHSLPTFNKRLRDTDEETISKKITYTGISSTMNHLESHSFRDKTRNAKPINDISQSVSEKPIMNVEIQMNQNKIKSHPKIPKSTSVKEHISSNSTTNLSSTSSSSDKPIFYEFDSSKIEKTKKSFTLSSSSVRRENGPFHINIRNKQSYIEESNQNKESITLPESINLIKEMLDKCEDYTLYKSIFRFKPGMTNSSAFHPKNITKNRYRDVYPYDSTRVVLNSKLYCKSLPKEIPFKNCIKKVIDTISKLSSDSETECKASFEIPLVSSPKELHSDKMYGYINASYVTMKITKSGVVNRYIAAQGPLKSTVLDFWQMIWNEKSSLVVMLTQCYEKNKKKCYKYWSDDNNVFNIGSFNITLESCTTMNGYIYRIFTIINADQMPQESNVRQVVHLQYTSWPDHGVPTDFDNFIQFIQVVREEKKGILENTIVHCSAGIGRSGVLIMMDTVMCLIEANQPIFPINIVKEMRCCRALMIQTDIQFNFTCKALVHVYENKIVQPIDTFIDKPESV